MLPRLMKERHPAKDKPNQYQVYAFDSQRFCTHAGVVGLPRLNPKAILRMQRKWRAWRAEYLAANPGNYPLRTDDRPTVGFVIYPVGQRDQQREFSYSGESA